MAVAFGSCRGERESRKRTDADVRRRRGRRGLMGRFSFRRDEGRERASKAKWHRAAAAAAAPEFLN